MDLPPDQIVFVVDRNGQEVLGLGNGKTPVSIATGNSPMILVSRDRRELFVIDKSAGGMARIRAYDADALMHKGAAEPLRTASFSDVMGYTGYTPYAALSPNGQHLLLRHARGNKCWVEAISASSLASEWTAPLPACTVARFAAYGQAAFAVSSGQALGVVSSQTPAPPMVGLASPRAGAETHTVTLALAGRVDTPETIAITLSGEAENFGGTVEAVQVLGLPPTEGARRVLSSQPGWRATAAQWSEVRGQFLLGVAPLERSYEGLIERIQLYSDKSLEPAGVLDLGTAIDNFSLSADGTRLYGVQRTAGQVRVWDISGGSARPIGSSPVGGELVAVEVLN